MSASNEISQTLKTSLSIQHTDNFGFLRLIAAIAVLFGHAFPLTGYMAPGLMANGVQALAVKVFFVISGFLITESWMRDQHITRYAMRRILRIFPGLIALVFLTVFFFGPVLTTFSPKDYFFSPSTYAYFLNIAMSPRYNLPGVFENNIYPTAVNGSLWTLPVELCMYILMPAAVIFSRYTKFNFHFLTILLCIFSIYFVRIDRSNEPYVLYGTNLKSALDVAPYFFLGASAKMLRSTGVFNNQIAIAMLIAAPFLTQNAAFCEILLYIVLPYTILSFGIASQPVFAAIGRHGDFSYGIYLYGFLIQQMVAKFFQIGNQPYANFTIALIPTAVLAWFSWQWVEKPMLAMKPSRSKFYKVRLT